MPSCRSGTEKSPLADVVVVRATPVRVVGRRHRHAGQHGAGGIGDASGDAAAERLRLDGARDPEQEEKPQNRGETSP